VSVTNARVIVGSQTDVIGPSQPMCGPLADGQKVTLLTAPGCWGPMITPALRAGHEVTQPLEIDGAEPGDAIAVQVVSIQVRSDASLSGTHKTNPEFFCCDPCSDALCRNCGAVNPSTYLQGWGEDAVRCSKCGAPVTPFSLDFGFTMAFDVDRKWGVAVGPRMAQDIAVRSYALARLPPKSRQHPALLLARADLTGVWARCRPFVGNLGTSPAVDIPCNRNAGDSAKALQDPGHPFHLPADDFWKLTDGHMDSPRVGPGCLLLLPVRIAGAGLYAGDVHAMQGDGELAGHATDVSADVVLKVRLVKHLSLDGPLLFPRGTHLPSLARPYSVRCSERLRQLRIACGQVDQVEDILPVGAIGSGASLNEAIANAVTRLALFTSLSEAEIKVRATLAGGVRIARLPGVAEVYLLAPSSVFPPDVRGMVVEHYRLQ